MTDRSTTTLTGVAVAVVALSRFIATTNPALGPYLQSALDGAADAGVKPEDLELLRMLVKSTSPV